MSHQNPDKQTVGEQPPASTPEVGADHVNSTDSTDLGEQTAGEQPPADDPPAPAAQAAEGLDVVRAAQLAVCTQIVPEALQLRLAAYQANPKLGRTAGHRDPRVRELEGPFLRARPAQDEPTRQPAGARRSRTSK